MDLLIISLTDLDYKEDVLLALQASGIQKASIWDAKNLNSSLSSEFSLFSGFFAGGSTHDNEKLIIMSMVKDKEVAKEFLDNLELGGIKIKEQDILSVMVLPLAFAFNKEIGMKEDLS